MQLKTLNDINVEGKRVLMRVDFNVPLSKGETPEIQDDTRIQGVLPTLTRLREMGAKQIVLMSHIGRPKGEAKPELSTKVVAERLSELLSLEVSHAKDCVDIDVSDMGEIVMLENVRFHAEEKSGDRAFAEKLSKHGDVFVNDAFAVCHRDQASVTEVARVMKEQGLPVAAGLLVQRESEMLSKVLEAEKAPFVMIVSGAKVNTKIGMITNFHNKVNTFVIGGGIANTFLAAEGFDVADSLYEEDKLEVARNILLDCEKYENEMVIPVDGRVASEFSRDAEMVELPVEDIEGDMKILDLGSKTIDRIVEILNNAELIVWNGPLGVYEFPQFMEGTKRIAEAIAGNKEAITIIGGGDTVDAVNNLGISFDEFTHVSTGGGAMIEYLEGKPLPGMEVLMD